MSSASQLLGDAVASAASSVLEALRPAASTRVHKFGGSSVADAARIAGLAPLVDDGAEVGVVVVSAMAGTTNALVAMAVQAASGQDWSGDWSALRERHLETAATLDPDNRHGLQDAVGRDFDGLRDDLLALAAAGGDPAPLVAQVHGLGELVSSRLVQAALGGEAGGWQRLDARDVLVVHPGEMGVGVDWEASRERFADWRARRRPSRVVVTGFIARDAEGRSTTLGRNGSDYSAAIFANLFDADELLIWTDVDGVLSADPRLVPDAMVLPTMSYAEACELAYFGAKVLHPQTMAPVQSRGIPLCIRNTLNPSAPGTWILQDNPPGDAELSPVKGLTIVREMAVLELAGNAMVGVPGTAEKLFAALHRAGVSVVMISQGSSEHSICCVIRDSQAERARTAVEAAFAEAIADTQAQGVRLTRGISILAAVGDGMVGIPGVAARLFAALAQARVNIRAIAQGSSERNISVAIADADATRALRAAHSAFWLSPQTVSVGLIGPGQVGRALLSQMATVLPRLRATSQVDLRLRGIANSGYMALDHFAIHPDEATTRLTGMTTQAFDPCAFAAHIRAEHIPHALIVDCSGSDAIARHYPEWLAAGIHVVTPSKHAGSGDWERYVAIREAQRGGSRFMYEATVGAGLPVISTLRNLLDTGDTVLAIDGMLSGTLAWLFNSFDGSRPFSALVREARELGYTEPDPRDDLSGLDVARKLVILARESGRELSLDDVRIESLVPEPLRDVPRDEFLARLEELDGPMQRRLEEARAQDRQLRHIAHLSDEGARVGVVALPGVHACCHTRLTDNLVQFTTGRYADNPLVVQGPGAGPQVTAAGVFGDVLAIAHSLSAGVGVQA
ncbi:bifunctional aspartate kinase/homoserine dehydrogenase I [Luteimonas composti]|uniref:Bifunctional aspartokinase/homoserine dehydrogenase n=1 Tax=Luteimonas composti TaxID=398257 RepID=A0ABT6MRK5_9GAMM|nr:bifunctional aspartate kinase/homoserine dehydrogenase I [Luteimonas composti]MDH7453069.1 bifunctional aspartate kinase/homoserine dehydrogenase I [Luteimonas composti]